MCLIFGDLKEVVNFANIKLTQKFPNEWYIKLIIFNIFSKVL